MRKHSSKEVDRSTYIVPSSDEKGHGMSVTFRMDPRWKRELNIILKSSKFPDYLSISDIIRHALYIHLQYLNTIEKIEKSELCQLRTAVDELIEDEIQQSFNKLLNKLDERVGQLIDLSQPGEARRRIFGVINNLMGMKDGFWKKYFLKKIISKYHGLVTAGEVSLVLKHTVDLEDEEVGIDDVPIDKLFKGEKPSKVNKVVKLKDYLTK